jgi:hypothetical protein
LQAIATSPSLHDVKAAEALIVVIHPAGPDEDELAGRLHLRDQDQLVHEEPVPVPESISSSLQLPAMDDELSPVQGVGGRTIIINGHRWVATCPQNGLPARLWRHLDLDDAWGYLQPARLQTWARFGFTEEASRTSGYDAWEIGSLSDDVLYWKAEPDEDAPSLGVRARRSGRSCEAEVVEWLLDLSNELDLDLVMLAVERLIGFAQGMNDVPSTGFGGQSDTLMCGLELSVDIQEILREVRSVGRGDAHDAVRDPSSAAAQKRAERLAAMEDFLKDDEGTGNED